ncbi:Spo0E family sporulation regulatory protein-aspartic acid phosphatase [Cytobacillus sp. Hz8]|uniref:Spo0E family sporulation regulatory protein-aspartic acid phosphatase n=1 Tax=Cytobacillus sp. Hz8 TaxID=3347168 RepID=UPI0035DCBF8E
MQTFLVTTIQQLEEKIAILRKNMIEFGLKHGLNNEKTIQMSQELDCLIYKYQLLIN